MRIALAITLLFTAAGCAHQKPLPSLRVETYTTSGVRMPSPEVIPEESFYTVRGALLVPENTTNIGHVDLSVLAANGEWVDFVPLTCAPAAAGVYHYEVRWAPDPSQRPPARMQLSYDPNGTHLLALVHGGAAGLALPGTAGANIPNTAGRVTLPTNTENQNFVTAPNTGVRAFGPHTPSSPRSPGAPRGSGSRVR